MKNWLAWGLLCAVAMVGLLTAPTLAQFNQQLLTGITAAGGACAGSVWSPTDKNTHVTLSTTTCANDTATVPSGATTGSWWMVRGTQTYNTSTSNKKVFTVKVQAACCGGYGWFAGVDDGTQSLTASAFPGNGTHSYGFQTSDTAGGGGVGIYQDGATSALGGCAMGAGGTSSPLIFPVGSTAWIAVDFSANKLYCSANCQQWLWGATGTVPNQVPNTNGNPDNGSNPSATLSASNNYRPAWAGNATSPATNTVIINTTPLPNATCQNITGFSNWG